MGGDDLALVVERARLGAEHDLALVRLRQLGEEPQQARRLTEADQQHAGRAGVERARVPDPLLAEDAPAAGDDVVRRPARGLVDDDEPVRPVAASSSSTRLGRRRRVPQIAQDVLDPAPVAIGGVATEGELRRALQATWRPMAACSRGSPCSARRLVDAVGQRGEPDHGAPEVGLDVDAGDGDQLEPLVVDPLERLGHDLADAARSPGPSGDSAGQASSARPLRHGRTCTSMTSISGNDHTNRSTLSSTRSRGAHSRRHDREAERGPLPLVLVVDLGGRDLEPAPGALEDRLDRPPASP